MSAVLEIPVGTEALIFDCDGTLVDTLPLYAAAWSHGFASSGAVMQRSWYLQRAGYSEHALMDLFEKDHALTVDRGQVVSLMRQRFLEDISGVEAIATVAAIARSHHGRLPLAVASGGSRQIVSACLQAVDLASLFTEIVTIEDVRRPKPAPDLFVEAARRLQVSPANCIVFEDSPQGMDAARSAGMYAIDVREQSLDVAGVSRGLR
jgi:beta-phosphoglucomutase-like phosphatase (HAD superfamily)